MNMHVQEHINIFKREKTFNVSSQNRILKNIQRRKELLEIRDQKNKMQ
jgi:hypothetical protein